MGKYLLHGLVVAIPLFAGVLVGCSGPEAAASAVSSEPTAPAEEPKPLARVSDRPGNTAGVVPILEYHGITKEESRWDRSMKRFKEDLERLYSMGFRPVTLDEYLDDKMNLPPGASPVIMTFDDARPNQFALLEDGSIDPNSGVGIWKAFADEHPDFPVKGIFYVLPEVMWGQSKMLDRKLEMLKEWGSVLGSHTVTHGNLKKMNDEQVKKELAGAIDYIESKGFSCTSIALPFGISPQNKDLLKEFTYNGKTYRHRASLLVGANPAPSPESDKLDPYRLPRIQAIEGVNGITFWLDKIESGDVQVYVQP